VEETADLCRAANAVVKVVQADVAMTRIAAGWVKGTGQEGADRLREVVKSGVPLRVASTPKDFAEVVTFLADPGSRHMTGTIVPVDAGFRLLVSIARRMLGAKRFRGPPRAPKHRNSHQGFQTRFAIPDGSLFRPFSFPDRRLNIPVRQTGILRCK
jgi:Enoyl-(Acyl carrier protein) reductase